ncbi:MAG: hypothetical protein ACP5P1_02740 [Acidimicrobiales bacterium]
MNHDCAPATDQVVEASRRRARSDWTAVEQQRGFWISSTVLQSTCRDCVLELLDEIESLTGLRVSPVIWPVGIPGDFRDVVDRSNGTFVCFARTWETTPVFVCFALTNFGVRHLLDAVVDLASRPWARADIIGHISGLEQPLSGFVFKVQANMDPAHRDGVAFVGARSARFERGMTVIRATTGSPFPPKYAASVFGSERDTIDEAYLGDVIGLTNISELCIDDTLHQGEPISFPADSAFEPELFTTARALDTSRSKQFRGGLDQLEREGVIQARTDGTLIALFDSPYWLQRLQADHPDWQLEPVLNHQSPS